MIQPLLSIVVATRDRHKQLITTLHAITAQVNRVFGVEVIVSVDGPDTGESAIVAEFGQNPNRQPPDEEKDELEPSAISFSVLTSTQARGDWGATPRDAAISVARGRYVVFWDDDNIYYNTALHHIETLAMDSEDAILVYRTRHWHQKRSTVIPGNWKGTFAQSDIDTMCVCVRADVARRAAWATEGRPRDCDYRWLKRLVDSGAIPVFHDLLIGEHL